jgi:hypothetical protein
MQKCSNLKLAQTIHYHAKVYFERILASSPSLPSERYIPLLFACLSLAIKVKHPLIQFHERR